ncbi:MAG TPA: hypothetical protein VLM91_01815 [Candidatus Methylomirabilis sp.]|nr:hypothetical protein [Candidatus Methylomirabilis sp.]
MIRYEHTQRGTTILVTLLTGMLLLLGLTSVHSASQGLLFTIIGVLGICGFLFSSLTVRITDRALRWEFGFGLLRKEIPLAEIEGAEVTETTFLQGWGIHHTSRGWLYNVSGFQAVVVRLKNGKTFLLGTDEPERLRAALLKVLSL